MPPKIHSKNRVQKWPKSPKTLVNQGSHGDQLEIGRHRKLVKSECTPHLGLVMVKVSSEGPRCCFHWGQKSRMPEIPKNAEIPEIPGNAETPQNIRPPEETDQIGRRRKPADCN